jgi:ParB family chromosome partitioning protein
VIDVKRKVLGRGLEALISTDLRESVSETERVKELDIERIEANPHQPRSRFDRAGLEQLAASIERNGLLQPVVVRRRGGGYQLIMGERRLRAARLAGKTSIPAIVREADDAESLKLALLENLQREDLNPIDEARGYLDLKDGFGFSIADIARMVGKDRSTVANTLRLLGLPEKIIGLISSGQLTAGHARAILAIEDDDQKLRWAERVINQGITVREIEKEGALGSGRARKSRSRRVDPRLRAVEEILEAHFGTKVSVASRKSGGVVSIEFYSDEDLERILERMGVDLTL